MNTLAPSTTTERKAMTAPPALFEAEEDRGVPRSSPPQASLFADIVFDRPLDHAYTYAVPETLASKIGVGRRVEVPFGKGGKATAGFCVRVTDVAPTSGYEIKTVTRVLDDDAIVDDHIMKLTRWMADYYLCGWGQVLHAVVPAGVRDNAGTRVASFVEALPKDKLPNPLPTVTPQQKSALDKLKKENRPLEMIQLARLAKCTVGVISGLVKKGLVRRYSERIENADAANSEREVASDETQPAAPIELNADQLRVWEQIRGALQTGGYHPFLLHGVTGSGKTEVYLRAIEEVVKQGKEVIVLVPEISLTPQTLSRFKGRCGNLAVLHSHLTDAERGGYWRRVASGQVHVVVGARSAVFAPTRKLGLIIIDEEHENTFKQESTPRYHARDVAVMRARLEGIPILMGSATPSLESWANAERGNYTLLSMPNRVESRPLPAVKLVDLRHEPKSPGRHGAIGPTLEDAMRKRSRIRGKSFCSSTAADLAHTSIAKPVAMWRSVPTATSRSPSTARSRRSCATIAASKPRPFRSARAASSRRCGIRGLAPKNCKRRLRRSSLATCASGWTPIRCPSPAATSAFSMPSAMG